MSDRYTKSDALHAMQRLADATGNRIARSWNDVGGWELDANPTYGGYVINEIVNEHGGVTRPFGDQRHPARQFCEMVNFAIGVLRDSYAKIG